MKISLNEEKQENSPILEKQHKFKDLSLPDKAGYIWDYYKWYIIGAALAITLLVVTIPNIIENSKDCVLYSVFLNTNIKGQEYTSLMDDYTDSAQIDMKNKRITLDCSLYIDRKNPSSAAMQSSQKLTALFASKTIDVVVSDKSNFEFCSSQGAYKDLKEILPQDLCEKYKDYFIEAENPETGEMTAYGLSLINSEILNTEEAFEFEPILSVCLSTDKQDNAIKFIKYLLGEI